MIFFQAECGIRGAQESGGLGDVCKRQLLQILVSDTGPGIPNDQLNKVFQAFQQGEAGLTRRYGGIGLGLPLASSLAMALNGHINVVALSLIHIRRCLRS